MSAYRSSSGRWKSTLTDLRENLVKRVAGMNEGQLGLVSMIVDTFSQPITSSRNPSSDVVDAAVLEAFGDLLKLHHSLSAAYLDKTRFEVALERILRKLGRKVERPASRTNRGHDITVNGSHWSLKTHGDSGIKTDSLFISKFMELGGGQWGNRALTDLGGLRDQFLHHLEGYDRIFQLRYFRKVGSVNTETHSYELVEIPKTLMLQAKTGTLSWAERSRTNPRCGYCTVADPSGTTMFRLYFDGGGERKLQIKDLRKAACIVHATWEFDTTLPAI